MEKRAQLPIAPVLGPICNLNGAFALFGDM
jgi:hypothetical protein